MKYRVFGNTGLKVSELGFGGIPILRLEAGDAVGILRHAFEKGITFYDTANQYKDSEAKIGIAFSGMRDKVVLATKTLERTAAGAAKHLENSLRMLKTDYIDLYQLHQVAKQSEWETASGPGGALELLYKAKQQGKVRHIGVTSHNLEMAVKLVKTGLFASIQFPFNIVEDEAKDELHVVAQDMGIGILAMKPFAGGAIDDAALAFKFLRQYPNILVIPGYDSLESVDQIVSIYDQPNVVTEEDIALMDKVRCDLGRRFCRRCEYCLPCPNGVVIPPAMGYPQLVSRTSEEMAAAWMGAALKSAEKCTGCGACVSRCPYQLPIPEILKKNYERFGADRFPS